jgi:hypothetical protein
MSGTILPAWLLGGVNPYSKLLNLAGSVAVLIAAPKLLSMIQWSQVDLQRGDVMVLTLLILSIPMAAACAIGFIVFGVRYKGETAK